MAQGTACDLRPHTQVFLLLIPRFWKASVILSGEEGIEFSSFIKNWWAQNVFYNRKLLLEWVSINVVHYCTWLVIYLLQEKVLAGCRWLTPVILATPEAEIRRIKVQSQPGEIVHETLSRKYPSHKGLVEWLKVKALSSNPSTTKRNSCLALSFPLCLLLWLTRSTWRWQNNSYQ
jgi:hypothetical protein